MNFSKLKHAPLSMLIISLISIFSLFSLNTQAQCTAVTESDSLELVSLLSSLNTFNDTISSPISEWEGITLTEDGCHILSIEKNNTNENTQLLDWNFPYLESLIIKKQLSYGFLPIVITPTPMTPIGLPLGTPAPEIGVSISPLYPMEFNPLILVPFTSTDLSLGALIDFSNMPNLKTLKIYNNSLVGTIPNFNHLPNLEELHFHANELTDASIPDFSNLPNLKVLKISQNEITSTIPDFSNLSDLEILQLTENEVSGEIPNFSNLPNLTHLYLSDNQLSGSIPDFSNSPNLIHLYLNDNQLNGSIPNFNLDNLTDLYLNYNQLNGSIPNFDLGNLTDLFANNNQLSESIPDFENLNNLINLYLHHNELTGEMPNFSNLESLNSLYLYDNELTGAIPNFDNLTNLVYLLLHNNQLSESLPNFDHLANLQSLALNNNLLSGSIPNFNNFANLKFLGIENNQLSGTIPNLNNFESLIYLSINNNLLSGSIPNFDNLPALYKLFLNNNLLSGSIPNFDNLPALSSLHLNNNQLSGSIPNFDSLPNLIRLYLNNNQLSGAIPLFEELSLHNLHLHNNQLHGLIPDFNFINLQDLTVCDNDLSAPLPSLENCPLFDWDESEIDLSCINFVELAGYIYHDENANCIQDPDEAVIPNGRVYINDGYALAIADENGFYKFKIDTGTYALTYEPPIEYWEQSCPAELEFFTQTISSYDDDYTELHIGNQALINCPALSVELGTPLQRRCFENTYHIEYCNHGTIAAENSYLEVFFPEDIIPLSSDLEYEEDGEGLLTFDLGNVDVGECQSFSIIDSVSCDAILGSTSCVEATIYPNYKCFELLPLWDESDLNITGYCQNDSISFVIENQGEDMSVSTQYRVYENDILSAVEIIQLDSGEELKVDFENTGVTYRVAAQQTPNHPLYDIVQAVVEACDDDIFSLGLVNSQSDNDGSIAFESDCQEIIGAYDPNDKLVTPSGIGDAHCITTEDELTYKIRFQNTGNDTAFTVIVVDTINTAFLDINSVTMAASSHDYDFKVINGNVLEWTFDNILLVDSNANETDSHGFLQFKIKQQANNPINSIIRNEADIYFDYNPPITTPETFNQVCFTPEDFNNLDIDTHIEENGLNPNIYPNPINEYCIIELPNSSLQRVRITDINGREVIAKQLNSTSDLKINTAILNPGLFYIHLYTKEGYTVKKLIKQ